MTNKTIAFKGFDKNLKCRDFQFEVGKTYEHEGKVEACSSGFHACEDPFDVWSYYDPFDSRFAVVEISGQQETHDDGTKIAAARIEIIVELTLSEYITKAVDWAINKCKTSSGYSSTAASSGYSSTAASSGDSSKAASSGNHSTAASSGDSSKAAVDGENCAAAAVGKKAMVSGSNGSWLAATEYDVNGKCLGFATGCVGKKGLKPGVYYKAEGGKLVSIGDSQ